MVFTKIKTKDIKIADSELKIIPSKKEFRKIRRNYNFDPDNLFVIVDKNFNLKYFLNSYKFALIHNIEEINCIILEKGEYYDGKSGSIELNTKAKKQAGVSALCIKPRKTKTEKIGKYVCERNSVPETNGGGEAKASCKYNNSRRKRKNRPGFYEGRCAYACRRNHKMRTYAFSGDGIADYA